MRMVLDAVAVRPGSAAIVTSHLLTGWRQIAPEDEILVLTDGEPRFGVPDGVAVARVTDGTGLVSRLGAQSFGVRRACRRFGADAVLSAVTAGTFLGGGGCPRGAIVYDVRHEIHPDQFRATRRLARRLSYGWTFRRADALFCISDRTRRDLTAGRHWLGSKALSAHLGADHARRWRAAAPEAGGGRHALAFGHFPNKNVDAVLRAWVAIGSETGITLRICGLDPVALSRARELAASLGISDRVDLLGWLSDEEFQRTFAAAAVVLFPSNFEGFGLPAVEAMVLGIPVVISGDDALAEVSGGHAVVAAEDTPEALAGATMLALRRTREELEAARAHAQRFTWARMAATVRGRLQELAGAGAAAGERP